MKELLLLILIEAFIHNKFDLKNWLRKSYAFVLQGCNWKKKSMYSKMLLTKLLKVYESETSNNEGQDWKDCWRSKQLVQERL